MLQQLLQGKKVSFQVMLSALNKMNHTQWVSKAVPVFMIPNSFHRFYLPPFQRHFTTFVQQIVSTP